MSQAERTFISGMQYYTPAMQCGARLGQDREDLISFGAPAADSETDISADTIDADAGTSTTLVFTSVADAPFGRTVQIAASGATGGDLTCVVHGRDYLGQHMQETIVVANGDGTTAQESGKAFYYVDKIVHDGGAGNAVTASAGWGPRLGLPYVTQAVEYELEDEVRADAGTLAAPVFTDPQTGTTGDPRGLYTPTGTLDGSAVFKIWAKFSDYVNASNNGGLHGIAHYNG